VAKVNIAEAEPRPRQPKAVRALPWKCASFAAVLTVFAATLAPAQNHPTETQVKSAYLFNFGKFVSWPLERAASSDSFPICILGKDPFGSVLDATVKGESIGGKKITLRKLASMPEAAGCRVLFVSASEQGHVGPILAAAQRMNALTVSDIPDFAEHGGVIGLVAQADKIRFEVNRAAAEKSNLVLSSELLKVATKVIDKETAGQ
jgi:YfiR/HmsC-like